MNRDVHDALAAEYDSYSIDRRLHEVPPHAVNAVHVDGRRAVCKHDTGPTGAAALEGRVMAFVGDRTTVPVPEVLHVSDDHYVVAWHPDAPAPGADHAVDEDWAHAAGRGLATLHDETEPLVDGYGQLEFGDDERHRVATERSTWHEAAIDYVRRRRETVREYGHAETVDAVLEHLRARPAAFVDAGPSVCTHGWASPEHVAVRDGEVACVVDFEHALAAPGEYDYWRTVIPTFADDATTERRAFRAGYESARPLPEGFERRAPAYRLLTLSYYLESLHVQDHHGPDATAERATAIVDAIHETLD
jgi:fructosamine-3-kinase